MAGEMRQALAAGAAIAFMTFACAESGSARSLLRDVEHGLKNVKRELCASIPTSKCNPPRKSKPAAKSPVTSPATPADKQAVPPAKDTKTKPAATKPSSADQKVPVPKPKPKDLKPEAMPAKPPPVVAKPPLPPKPVAVPVPVPKPAPAPAVVTPLKPEPAPSPPLAAPAPQTPAENTGCLQALTATGASFAPVPQPGSNGQCMVETPVKLIGLKTLAGMVKLPDQPTVNCPYALKLQSFVSDAVQPLAQSAMQSPIAAMGTGPGFDCRGRNGDTSSKISEHASGNAVDIVFFTFANKKGVLVKDALNDQADGFAFLRDVRAAACKAFTTVLGPGANPAHAEHFHIDLEERKGGYRICE